LEENNRSVNPTIVDNDVIVRLEYDLTVDDQVVDSSRESEPIEFIQGHGNIIPGLERELYGMGIGDSKSVHVSALDGYGESDPDAIVTVPRSDFPDHIPLEPGVQLEMESAEGDMLSAVIVETGQDAVTLDFNHPLAGKDLLFQVKVIGLRLPTEEEIAHGHVHSGEVHEDDSTK